MALKGFYDRKRAFEEFKILRKKLSDAVDNPRGQGFHSLFKNMKEQAAKGDVVVQDVVAYFYRDGVFRSLSEDYLKYMYWEILAGAGGNEFAIDKLQFFLGYAYDEIVRDKDFARIKYENDINGDNYIYIIGRKLCEKLCQELQLDAKTLAQSPDKLNPYRPEYFRDLRIAIDKIIPKVVEEMKKPQN